MNGATDNYTCTEASRERRAGVIITERERDGYMLSPVRLSVCLSVVCLSVTLVHPT